MKNNCKIFSEKTVLRPFILLDFVFFFCTICSMIPAKPYLVKIIHQVGMPVDGGKALVYIGINTILGAFMNILTIKLIGKRILLMCCMALSVIFQIVLGLYATGYVKLLINNDWLPFILFCGISFIAGFGITPIPWILLGELFSMKSRGQLSGIAAAINFGIGFILTKTYLDIVALLSLPCTLIIYGVVGAIGIPYVYYNLPETESKTLQEIQEYFEK